MTKSEMAAAFALRMDGLTWNQIGEQLNYSAVFVRQRLVDVVMGINHQGNKIHVVYPELNKVLEKECNGCVSIFTEKVGISREWGYKILTGKYPMTDRTAQQIAATFDLTLREVFQREAEK